MRNEELAQPTRVKNKHKVKDSTERSDFAVAETCPNNCRGRRPRRPVIEVVSFVFVKSFKRTNAGDLRSPLHIHCVIIEPCCHRGLVSSTGEHCSPLPSFVRISQV